VPSGDNARAARQLAGQAGIQDVRAGLLPKDKAIAVQQLEADGQQVLLTGDGINDAPAPAAARTGVVPRQRHMRQGKTPVQQNAPRCSIRRGHGSSGTPFRAGGSGLLRG